MKKIVFIFSLLPLVFFFISCGNSGNKKTATTESPKATVETPAAAPQTPIATVKKYGIKSGIVTYENAAMDMKLKVVLYFDDYGAKEAQDNYSPDNSLSETSLCDGTNHYTLAYKTKTAFNRGSCSNGIAFRFDFNEATKVGAEYKVKKLANVTIAGKDCESFSMESSGNPITYAGWNNVCMLIDQTTSMGKMTYKTVSFEDNAVIPADKFKVPADFQIK